MTLSSQDLSGMPLDDFEPKPAAEAKQTDIEISCEAEISRLCPIQAVLIIGRSTGVVRVQTQAAPRLAKLGQCSDLDGRALHEDFNRHPSPMVSAGRL
jgi:hypothetical protein